MLETAKELSYWDLNTKDESDGYYVTEVPTATDHNVQTLVDAHNDLVLKYNELVEVVNQILKVNIVKD